MLKFEVYDDGRVPDRWPLRNAYLVGADSNPVRADIAFEDGLVIVDKHEAGTSALVLQHNCGDLGEVTVQTCLLPERDEPYLLVVELARHRLMTLYNKLEEWSMFELPPEHSVPRRADKARALFLEALSIRRDDPAKAAELAQDSLITALDGTEELALAHSELLLNRRRETKALPTRPFGIGVAPTLQDPRVRAGVLANFDFLQLPMPWRLMCPEENDYDWTLMDAWVEWAGQNRMPIIAGPIVGFDPQNLPDWLYIWEHDYDTVRDVIYEHTERVVKRYQGVVAGWNVISGLHINDHFTFNFEQLMDLTRMCTMLVKKLHPKAKLLVEVRQPFGEYYARNQRSIPPLIYADLITQSAIPFDALTLRLPMGQAMPGQYTRDLMQISCLLEQYGVFGKPLHLTVAAPSSPVTSMMIHDPKSDQPADASCGYWRRPWSPVVQSHWLEAVFQIAMSKPYVESVAWQDLIDHQQIELPLAGLVSEDQQVKESFKRLVTFRRTLLGMDPPADSAGGGTGGGDSGDSASGNAGGQDGGENGNGDGDGGGDGGSPPSPNGAASKRQKAGA